jgi:hypothetical protein
MLLQYLMLLTQFSFTFYTLPRITQGTKIMKLTDISEYYSGVVFHTKTMNSEKKIDSINNLDFRR